MGGLLGLSVTSRSMLFRLVGREQQWSTWKEMHWLGTIMRRLAGLLGGGRNSRNHYWNVFVHHIWGNMMEQLLALQQTSSVGEYRRNFELLSALFPDLPETMLENAFVNGLQEEIKTELRLWEPKGLSWVMKVAQMLEETNLASSWSRVGISTSSGKLRSFSTSSGTLSSPKFPPSPSTTRFDAFPFSASPSSTSHTLTPSSSSSSTTVPTTFRRLTDAKMRSRREKGLCF